MISLFRGRWSSPPVLWEVLDLAGFAKAMDQGRPAFYLDERRLERDQRYWRGETAVRNNSVIRDSIR